MHHSPVHHCPCTAARCIGRSPKPCCLQSPGSVRFSPRQSAPYAVPAQHNYSPCTVLAQHGTAHQGPWTHPCAAHPRWAACCTAWPAWTPGPPAAPCPAPCPCTPAVSHPACAQQRANTQEPHRTNNPATQPLAWCIIHAFLQQAALRARTSAVLTLKGHTAPASLPHSPLLSRGIQACTARGVLECRRSAGSAYTHPACAPCLHEGSACTHSTLTHSACAEGRVQEHTRAPCLRACPPMSMPCQQPCWCHDDAHCWYYATGQPTLVPFAIGQPKSH